MAPVTAEYLIGYDDYITDPLALVFGVLFFAPLYGAPAVLIREVTRRFGLGWPTILLMATAFGLIEAGLIDQSLFDPAYRDITFWDDLRDPTFIPWFGSSAFMLLLFVSGHVFGSIAAPIALAESWWPERRDRPWLGVPGLLVIALLWGLGALFVLQDQLGSTTFRISPGQLAGTAAAVVGLVVLALTRRRTPPLGTGAPPAPWVVALVTALLLTVRSMVPTGWVGTLMGAGAILAWLVLAGRWSRRESWTGAHVVAAVIGDLLSIGLPAFLTTPLGDLDPVAKLVSNVALLALVLAVAARGYRREQAAGAGVRHSG